MLCAGSWRVTKTLAADMGGRDESSTDGDTLLADHTKAISRKYDRQLQLYERVLKGFLAAGQPGQEGTGQAILRSLSSVRWPSRVAASDASVTNCTLLDPPQFNIQSAEQDDQSRFARANALGKTLEVAAITGEWNGRYPSSETFILGFNRSQASIGGVLTLPPHREGATLTIDVELHVENVGPGYAQLIQPLSLLNILPGYEDLPLRGTAVSWCTASLSLYGGNGSAATAIDFVSGWANEDGTETDDPLSSGIIPLISTVGLRAKTSAISVFVDATCFAGAEKSQTAFAEFKCRTNGDGDGTGGIYVPPSRIRVHQMTVHLCEFPLPHL